MLNESEMESRVERSMGAGTEKGGSQGLGSLLASVSEYKTGLSALLESRLNTSHSPTGRPVSAAAAFSPEAESSPSEPLRISKLFSRWLSTGSSSGILLMISGPWLAQTQRGALGLSSSQFLEATFLALRVLPLTLECPGVLSIATTASVFKLRPFLVWPRVREAVPRLLGSSTSCVSAETRSSRSLSSLKITLRRVWARLWTLGAKGTWSLLLVGWTSSNMVKGTRGPACLARPGGLGVQGGPSSSRPF